VERGGSSTAILRLHVDAQGRTQRAALYQSSGIPALDEAALNAAREARFRP
jgi:protein TonB